MAKEPTSCCPVAGIGLNFLTPTSPSRPLLDLLGLTDLQLQEYLAEGHPYGFILGHGRNTAFKDYKEAAKFLMERNIPDIAQDRQTKAIFIPETHLPKMPRIVDLPNYESLKHISTDEKLALSGLKRGKEDIANVAGDFVEKELSEALKTNLLLQKWSFSRALPSGKEEVEIRKTTLSLSITRGKLSSASSPKPPCQAQQHIKPSPRLWS